MIARRIPNTTGISIATTIDFDINLAATIKLAALLYIILSHSGVKNMVTVPYIITSVQINNIRNSLDKLKGYWFFGDIETASTNQETTSPLEFSESLLPKWDINI